MAYKKKRQDLARNYVGAMLVFILAVGIGLIFFYVVAQKTIDSSSQERMKTNVARQSEHLRTILNIHYSYLEGVAEKIAESNELMNEENKEVLTVFQKIHHWTGWH